MSILETLRKHLSTEQVTAIEDALGDDFDYDLVPRSRLNKVIGQRNNLRKQLAESSQAPATKAPGAGASDDDDDDDALLAGSGGGDPAASSAEEIEAIKKQFKKEKDELAIRYSALEKLRGLNAIDPELILNAGLLDMSKAKVEKDGFTVVWPDGDEDPFTTLSKSETHGFLFKSDEGGSGTSRGTGKTGGNGGDGGDAKLDSALDVAMGLVPQLSPGDEL